MNRVAKRSHSALSEKPSGDFSYICTLLDNTRFASDFSWSDIEVIAHYLDVFTIQRGQTIFHEGSSSFSMGIIIEGKVSIRKENNESKVKIITVLGPGQSLGEMSLVDSWPRSASAVADDAVTMLVLSREKFDSLVKNAPGTGIKVVLKIAQILSQRLRRTSGLLADYL